VSNKFRLEERPVHLGLGATALEQPAFEGGMAWYEAYGARAAADGVEGRLVSLHSFAESWTSWEMHPRGHELVVVTAGRLVLVQELTDGSGARELRLELGPGDAAINPPGVWHTADVLEPATALFITAGEGTEHRSR
jgi:mannose-6-phosphate isomerase-like protein (cupin superfamily)